MGLHDYTFYDLINRNAICLNNRDAWFEAEDQRTATFAEIKEQVDRLASGLQKLGVKKGDRICAVGKNSLEFFLLYRGAHQLAAVGGRSAL
jgi:acyl-coenzyme A synthetase/AMP-(fatty) acid ligase